MVKRAIEAPKVTKERRVFDDTFKAQAVARVAAGESYRAVAADIGVHVNLVRRWVEISSPSGAALGAPRSPVQPLRHRQATRVAQGSVEATLRARNEYLEKVLKIHGIQY